MICLLQNVQLIDIVLFIEITLLFVIMNSSEQFVFFWKPKQKNGYFGNWYPSPFDIDGLHFSCVEQYIMYAKARLFNDLASADAIMATKSPSRHKALGRKVQNFDQYVWNQNKEKILYDGLYAKFTQNADLREILLKTGTSILAEASPLDKIYGIGLDRKDPDAQDPSKWKGQNLLGKTMMIVRGDIQAIK